MLVFSLKTCERYLIHLNISLRQLGAVRKDLLLREIDNHENMKTHQGSGHPEYPVQPNHTK